MKVKKLILSLIVFSFICCSFLFADESRTITFSNLPTTTRLLNNNQYGFEVKFEIGKLELKEVTTKAGTFDELTIEGYNFTPRIGEPKLPMQSKFFAVPIAATVNFEIIDRKLETLDKTNSLLLHPVIPTQRSVSKSEDPSLIPFEMNEDIYKLDSFTKNELFYVEEIGYMRGVRLFQMFFEPISYNPVQGELQVTKEVTFRITFNHPDLAATEELLARTASYEFDELYAKTIFNWQKDNRSSTVRYPTKMLILCPVGYTSYIQSLVDWKIQQGYAVTIATIGSGGTITSNTTSAIISYMQSVWSSATAQNPAPTYLLIIGDESGTISIVTNSGITGTHPTDLKYVRLQGSDYVPEMYFGRFSVSSPTELTSIVNKTITFEKTQMTDLSYLGKVVMIAGADANWSPTHANGAINYGTQYYFNSSNGITSNTYLYPASASSDANIIANANEGRGYLNYTAHGSEIGWYDPSFTVSNANAMTNTGKFSVFVGNCCLTNKFNFAGGPCFGEAIIRKANAGGVIYIGGTNSTYWNEDYWWAVGAKGTATGSAPTYNASTLGTYDAMFHTHNEAFTNWAQTTGEVIWMGNMAVSQAASALTNYYWEIYSIMGDPSLMPYFGVPSNNTASYNHQILVGATSFTITGAAPYSRIGLTMNGIIYGTGITDASGNLTLNITPFTDTGTATLVITAQNRKTVMDNINIISPSCPLMTVSSVVYEDDNNDIPEYNESGFFDVTFTNVGSATATNVSCVLSCLTAGITITNNTITIPSLAISASTTVDNAFTLNISDNIANNTVANLTITMTITGYSPWTYEFTRTISAPALEFGNITISDPTGNNNGRLDSGETVTISLSLNNNGSSLSPSGIATMSCSDSGITINNGSVVFSAISASGNATLSFNLTASSSLTIGTVITLNFNATAGAYSADKIEPVTIGLILEDFETGNFNAFSWTMGTYPWIIDSSTHHSGNYSARSGTITHNQSSTLEIIRIFSSAGTLSFWYKVSSEASYDFLTFSVDGTVQGSWSGTVDWTQVSFNIPAGQHTLQWAYTKDVSVSSGSDCAWIDDIIFPISIDYIPPSITYSPSSFTQQLNPDQTAIQNLTIGNTGTGTLSFTVSPPTQSTTILNESFENGGSIPSGWTQAYVSGSIAWTFTTGGFNGHPSSAYNGTYNARFYYGSRNGYTTKLITPSLNLSEAETATLTFWHTQEVWSGDQDQLKVYYRTSATGNWNLITSYTSSIVNWTQETITLPSLSSTYYIAFEGIANYGYGVCLDKVVVTKSSSVNLPTWLTVAGGSSYSGNIAYNEPAQTIPVGFNSTGLSLGTYNTNLIISSNDPTNSSINIPVTLTVAGISIPVIVVNPLTINFGDVTVNSSVQEQFSIQNTGTALLSGEITTPPGYSVMELVSKESSYISSSSQKDYTRNTLSYSINPSSSKIYNLIFSPVSATTYAGNVIITSNDPNNPTVNIVVTGSGFIPNTPPTINLPESFSFIKNGTLQVDFSSYIYDADNDELQINYSGNNNILIQIQNYLVTFSAPVNWIGTETITFSVSDGAAIAYDQVEVIVYPSPMPNWNVVVYPNNSAKVYAMVTINGEPCELNDWVGAFVGNECRGMAEVVPDSGITYTTLLVNLAADGENISFKIFDCSTETVYPVLETYNLHFGEEVGLINLNGVPSIELTSPIVNLSPSTEGYLLSWNEVPYANQYKIYRSTVNPYEGFELIATVSDLQYIDSEVHNKAFYYVKAVNNQISKY